MALPLVGAFVLGNVVYGSIQYLFSAPEEPPIQSQVIVDYESVPAFPNQKPIVTGRAVAPVDNLTLYDELKTKLAARRARLID